MLQYINQKLEVKVWNYSATHQKKLVHIQICYDTMVENHLMKVNHSTSASSGDYVPVMVDHSDELPCRGVYFLHHGLQRRIRVTLVHDKTSDLKWKDVRELVVGRIRLVVCQSKTLTLIYKHFQSNSYFL
jgi:hypothetical protein